jgi:hypothetical protein
MRYQLPFYLLALLLLLFTWDAEAARGMVGTSENIHHLQDVSLTGPKGEKLFLGYKTSTTFFIAGVWMSVDGYVLGVQGDSKHYFSLPQGETLQRFQKSGALPDPLPKFEPSILDYLFGYSLWLIIVLWGGGAWLWHLWKTRKSAASPAGTAPG